MCQQKAYGCFHHIAGELALHSSGLLATGDQTVGSHGQDIKVRGQY